VHRAAFLKELLEPVPRENMHASKKIVEIKEAEDGGVLLHFKDGSKEHFDALIGADGIHGYARQHILGAGHPALKPVFAGFWDCRFLVPIERARKALGEEYFEEERVYNWVGDGGMFLHGIVNNGELVQCIAAVADEDWSPAEWKRDLDKNTLKKFFAHWTNSPIAKGMIEVSRGLLNCPSLINKRL
jgi:salicylate hydroxylase